MRVTHEHDCWTVIMGRPDKPGDDDKIGGVERVRALPQPQPLELALRRLDRIQRGAKLVAVVRLDRLAG